MSWNAVGLTPPWWRDNRPMAASQRFPIRYGVFRPLLTVLGMGPGLSSVDIDGDHVRVRMGWSFQAEIPLHSITTAEAFSGLVGGIGVHGWRGRWLVNGAASGLVTLEIDPPARARVSGVPVRLRALRVSVKSPHELLAALADGGVQEQRQHH